MQVGKGMGKERENLGFSTVAATVEKASTYVFPERLSRNAEVRGSIPPLLIKLLALKYYCQLKMGLGSWRDVVILSQPKRYQRPQEAAARLDRVGPVVRRLVATRSGCR